MTLSQPGVIRLLNRDVIPAWQSVGPVPKITIDFGNGRKLQRTLGGNIVMMLVLPDGRVADAYPGIYSAEDLTAEVQRGLEMIRDLGISALDRAYLDWHNSRALGKPVAAMTLSKAIVESPILKALGKQPQEGPDLSKKPLSAEELRRVLGESANSIVEADSRNNVELIRPAVHRWFAERATLPHPDECKRAMYQDVLHIRLDDPYLGLAEFAVPGT